ncbi:MAG TPA: cbb3-type cytochrome c oxidase subunit I, partial [Phototrophicaceae bacterium]|nr:cbb3-type cytochrome c oxidase subunit I [Phototrophicaceae bacterium]
MTSISIESPEVVRGQPYPGAPDNWKRFFTFSTDHKVIGIQYIVTSFVFFLIGGLFAMIIRGELITPEADLVDRTVYNALFTMHGSVMLFFWTFPVWVGLGNYLVPLMIGARDMAFPRLNAVSFWMIPIAGILMMSSFLIPGGPSQSGWWAYPPVSLQNPTGNLIN